MSILLCVCGCSSAGYMQAKHNGMYYWNPGGCETYQYYPGDETNTIYCVTDGVRNGIVLRPASYEDVALYQQQHALDQQSWQQSLNQLNQTLNQSNQRMQMQIMQAQQSQQMFNDANNFNQLNRSLRGIDDSLNKMANPYGWGYYRP